MIARTVEISGEGRRLRKERGFLVVAGPEGDLGRLPLDDLEVVLFAGRGLTCTGELMHSLAARAVPLVICDQRFVPSAVLWPVESHREQAGRIRAQAALPLPRRKRLWQELVQGKIRAQSEALRLAGVPASARIDALARLVKSGDGGNAEAEAARLYWPRLLGPDFRRDRDHAGVNALLNYGYTVLRAAVARAVMLAGLHPAFGLHHHAHHNTMPLLDDLVEPFRPVADLLALELARQSAPVPPPLDAAAKARLASLPAVDMAHAGVASPVSECMLRLARSLAAACEDGRARLALPESLRAPAGTGAAAP